MLARVGAKGSGWDGRRLSFLCPGTPLLTSPCAQTLRIPAPAECSETPLPRQHPSSHLWSRCLSHPLYHVSSAHPPISQYSAQDPGSFHLHPCSHRFFPLPLLLPFPSPPPTPPSSPCPNPKPPFSLIPSALHPYPFTPQPPLLSVTVFAAGKVCSLVWGIVLRTFSLSLGGPCLGGAGQGPLPWGRVYGVVCLGLWPPQPEAARIFGVQCAAVWMLFPAGSQQTGLCVGLWCVHWWDVGLCWFMGVWVPRATQVGTDQPCGLLLVWGG